MSATVVSMLDTPGQSKTKRRSKLKRLSKGLELKKRIRMNCTEVHIDYPSSGYIDVHRVSKRSLIVQHVL